MSGLVAKGKYISLIDFLCYMRSFSVSQIVSWSSNFWSQPMQQKSDWKLKQPHLHLWGLTAECSSWVCLQTQLGRHVFTSKPFLLGRCHKPSSSGLLGINLKAVHLQDWQFDFTLDFWSSFACYFSKWPQKHLLSEPILKHYSSPGFILSLTQVM